MTEKCYTCEKGNLARKKVDFSIYGESLGKFPAEVCNNCGETFFDEKTSDLMDEIAKKTGLWGLESETTVGKVGDSLDVRISKKLVDFLKLRKGEYVKVYPENRHKLIIDISATKSIEEIKK